MGAEVFAIFVPISIALGAFLMSYKINEQNNMTKRKMIEAGMDPSSLMQKKGRTYGSTALKIGAVMIGAGLGLFLARLIEWNTNMHDPEPIYFGLIGVFGGLGLIIAHNIARKQEKEDEAEELRAIKE